MKRALAKGVVQCVFGRLPGGSRAYRKLTRKYMGTQSSHIDKLARVWPSYVKVWEDQCGLELEGKRIWVHEGGYSIFPLLTGYLLTGRGPVMTNFEAELDNQYVAKAVKTACELQLSDRSEVIVRQKELQQLASQPRSSEDWIKQIDAECLAKGQLPTQTCDLVHSGGVLEHYKMEQLQSFISQSYQLLNSGGISSHIFDHRDHLYHADKQIPFLNHLRYSKVAYQAMFGHRLCYHNRLCSGEIRKLFNESSFAEVGIRRHILPEAIYVDSDQKAIDTGMVGLLAEKLHPQFQSLYTEADLHTAAGHYLYRKAQP